MKIKKLLSLFLALALVFSCAGGWSVRAEEAEDPALAPTLSDAAQTAVAEAAPLETIHTEELPFLRYIDEGQFFEADHVARLSEEETLDTYVFLNRDGTKSVYYMGRDVKFVDTDGTVRDKDTTLIPADGGYTMRQNDVGILLPEDPATGVLVVSGSHGLRLVPQGGSGTGVLSDNAVLYEDFYGEGMSLKYTPMLDGVKEDIILDSYSGVHSFAFALQAAGLSLYERDGVWCLAPSETAEAVFTLGEILVYDAVGKPTLGTLAVQGVRAGVYTLTVSAPVEYLTDPATVYPVTIDPTITSKDTMTAANIEDATVFSGYPNNNFGNYVFNTIGYQDATYGTGRVAVRLKGLLNDATYQGLSAADISSVLFYMKDGGSNYANVNIHALTGNSTWTESTIKNSNLGTVSDTVYANGRMGGSAWTAFNLTTLVRDWKDGDQNGQCGFLMVIADSTKKIGALSCEYGSGDYWPYVVVEYTVSSVLNYSVKDIVEGTSFTLTANTGGVAADITWTSNNTTVATVDTEGVVTGINAGTAIITATSDVFTTPVSCVVYVTVANGIYSLKNRTTGLFATITDASVAERTILSQQEEKLEDIQALAQLWRITYLGEGKYSIRPIHKLNMGMCAENSRAYSKSIGVQDSLQTVPSDAQWEIYYNTTGYVLIYGNKALAPAVSTTVGNIPLLLNTYSSANTAQRWILRTTADLADAHAWWNYRNHTVMYRTADSVSIVSNPTVYMLKGDTRTLESFDLSVAAICDSPAAQTFSWVSSAPEIISVDELTGTVSCIKTKDIIDNVTITGSTTIDGVCKSVSFTVCIKKAYSIGGLEFTQGQEILDANAIWDNMGYNVSYSTCPTLEFVNESLCHASILYLSGHGAQHEIGLRENADDEFLDIHDGTLGDIGIDIRDYDLSETELVIFDSCKTATTIVENFENLCSVTFERGAECVIGWTQTILAQDVEIWQAYFQSKLASGWSVIQAANYANSYMYNSDNAAMKSWRIYGNKDLVIAPTPADNLVYELTYIDMSDWGDESVLYSEENALELIAEYFHETYVADVYTVNIVYTNNEKTNYVVDFESRLHFSRYAGYTVIVEDGCIIGIRDNIERTVDIAPSKPLPELQSERNGEILQVAFGFVND